VPLPLILGVGLTPQDDYTSHRQQDKHEHDHEHDHDHEEHNHDDHQHHHKHDHDHEHHHHHEHHSHHLENDGFVSVSFQSERPFNIHKFEVFLTEGMPQEVFRAKGILWFSDSELRHIFQLSGPRYNLHADEWSTPPKNQLVFIGRKLNASEISSHLNKCLV
jgi:G3E family GTPase